MNWLTHRVVPVGLILIAVLSGLLLPSFYLSLLTRVYVFALLALSVDVLIGYLGLVPLGHAGIFGTSAYVLAYCLTRTEIGFTGSLVLSLASGVLISLLFGLLAVRTSGIYFIMITLAEGMIVWGIVQRWTTVTGGANGLRGIQPPAWMKSDLTLNYLILGVLTIVFLCLKRIVSSPFGLSLKGIQQRENRMSSLGYNVFLFKLLGFLLSGVIASISGVLFILHQGFISPSVINFFTSAEAVLMVILGGAGTLWGGILGSGIVLVMENVTSTITDRWNLILGLIFVATILFSREGILGFFGVDRD